MNRIVQDPSEFQAVAAGLRAARIIVVDTETSGLSVHNGDRICGFTLGPLDGTENYYFPIRHAGPKSQTSCQEQTLFNAVRFRLVPLPGELKNMPLEPTLEFLRQLFSDPEMSVVGHNLKFDLGMLRADGIEVQGHIYDTLVWAYGVDSSQWRYALDDLTARLLTDFKHEWHEKLCAWFLDHMGIDLKSKKAEDGEEPPNFSFVPIRLLGEYAMEDLRATRLCCKALMETALRTDLPKNFSRVAWKQEDCVKLEQRLVRTVFEMEDRGVLLDAAKLTKLYEQTQDEIQYHSEKLYELAGYSFQVSSWKQIWNAFVAAGGKVCYWSRKKADQGKQKADKYTDNFEKSNQRPCWNASAFAKYFKHLKDEGNQKAFDFVYHYYQADHRMRLSGNYLETMLQRKDVNDVLHTRLNQHGTKTGRFSSSAINCQNITKSEGNADLKKIEKVIGHQEDALNRRLRELFIPRPGYTWVKIDYKQIEYVIATYFSQDTEMIQRFWDNPNLDYHQITADLAGITRDQAKTVNFGTLYGMGVNSLAAMLGISKSEAQSIIDKMFSARPALKKLIRRVSNEGRDAKCVYLPYGRVVSVNPEKPYVALNYWVQGTTAYMMKERLVAVWEAIRKNHWPVRMLLTVHDEGDFEIATPHVLEIAPQIATLMCDVQDMIAMPVTCEISAGPSWGSLAEVPWVNPWVKQEQHKGAA